MLVGIDWGAKKVGLATADSEGIVIKAQKTLKRSPLKSHKDKWRLRNDDKDLLESFFKDWGGLEDLQALVLGHPRNQGPQQSEAKGAENLAHELAQNLNKNVFLVDESLSSWASSTSTNGTDDAGAAALILEDYFSQKARGEIPRVISGSRKSGQAQLLFIVLMSFIFIILGIGAYSYYDFNLRPAYPQDRPESSSSFVVDVPPGSHFQKLRADLEKEGFRISKLSWQIWLKLKASGKKLRVGEYSISRSWSAGRIMSEVLSGNPLLYKFTVPEGTNSYEIEKMLSELWPNENNFSKVVENRKFINEMEIPNWKTSDKKMRLEGFLFPETYSFQKYDSSEKLVRAMLDEFKERALPILEDHPWGTTPEGRYRLLTLASVVEKESGNKEEQPIIASVFWNRLEKKMKLQSDPTIICGLLPMFDGNIRKKDILNPSPWNTYTIPELPISPITNPGESALRATIKPAKTTYLFFVSRNDGTHVFSEDYKTHNSYVNEFQRKKSANK